jgi:hypothetical protein
MNGNCMGCDRGWPAHSGATTLMGRHGDSVMPYLFPCRIDRINGRIHFANRGVFELFHALNHADNLPMALRQDVFEDLSLYVQFMDPREVRELMQGAIVMQLAGEPEAARGLVIGHLDETARRAVKSSIDARDIARVHLETSQQRLSGGLPVKPLRGSNPWELPEPERTHSTGSTSRGRSTTVVRRCSGAC